MTDQPPTDPSARLPPAIVELQSQIDNYLRGLEFSDDARTAQLVEAMRDSLLMGGIRLRPLLALATAETIGRPAASALPIAAALEMIYVHALIHDSLPAIGRAHPHTTKPAPHAKFGEAVALLAGDALLAEAIALVLHRQPGDPAGVLAAVADLSHATGVKGLIGRQYIDSTTADDDQPQPAPHECQSSRLLGAAVTTVLSLHGEPEPASTHLRRFAAELNALSQIIDDIAIATRDNSAARAADNPERDRRERRRITANGLTRTRNLAITSHAHARAALDAVPGDTSTLQSITDYILTRHAADAASAAT